VFNKEPEDSGMTDQVFIVRLFQDYHF